MYLIDWSQYNILNSSSLTHHIIHFNIRSKPLHTRGRSCPSAWKLRGQLYASSIIRFQQTSRYFPGNIVNFRHSFPTTKQLDETKQNTLFQYRRQVKKTEQLSAAPGLSLFPYWKSLFQMLKKKFPAPDCSFSFPLFSCLLVFSSFILNPSRESPLI